MDMQEGPPGMLPRTQAPPAAAARDAGSRWLDALLGIRPSRIELLRPARAVAPLGWLLLGAGVLALAGAALLLQARLQQRAETARQRAALEAALDRLGVHPVGTPAAAAPGKRAALDEGQGVLDDLERPWHGLFDQLEAAAAAENSAVHVVQLTVEPRFAGVELIAEGRNLDQLVRFAQRLSGGMPVRSMTLTHFEWRDALGGHVISGSLQGELVQERQTIIESSGPRPAAPAAAAPVR